MLNSGWLNIWGKIKIGYVLIMKKKSCVKKIEFTRDWPKKWTVIIIERLCEGKKVWFVTSITKMSYRVCFFHHWIKTNVVAFIIKWQPLFVVSLVNGNHCYVVFIVEWKPLFVV